MLLCMWEWLYGCVHMLVPLRPGLCGKVLGWGCGGFLVWFPGKKGGTYKTIYMLEWLCLCMYICWCPWWLKWKGVGMGMGMWWILACRFKFPGGKRLLIKNCVNTLVSLKLKISFLLLFWNAKLLLQHCRSW